METILGGGGGRCKIVVAPHVFDYVLHVEFVDDLAVPVT